MGVCGYIGLFCVTCSLKANEESAVSGLEAGRVDKMCLERISDEVESIN